MAQLYAEGAAVSEKERAARAEICIYAGKAGALAYTRGNERDTVRGFSEALGTRARYVLYSG